ncbi:MAG: hypothetical protein ACRBFS_01875 [Aureispira sp.]
MLDKKLLALIESMRAWKKKIAEHPELLDDPENQKKNAAINKSFPDVIKALALAGGPCPELDAKREACKSLLHKLHVEQTKVIMQQASFYIDEYMHYIRITLGQRPVSNLNGIIISYTTSGVSALTGDVVKMWARNAIGEAVEVSLIALCTTGGAVIGNVPGALIGFFVGMTVDFLVNKLSKAIFGDAEKKAVADMKSQLGDYNTSARNDLTKKMQGSLTQLDTAMGKWEKELTTIVDLTVLSKIERDLKVKLQAAKDLFKSYSRANHPLGNRLLKEWVLENMGDDNDDANDYDYNVDEPTWALAVQTLKSEGALEKTTDDTSSIKKELTTSVINEELAFLSQVRNELRYTSINIKSRTFLRWAKEVRAYAQQVGGNAEKIKAKFNKSTLTFDNTDINSGMGFVNQIEETYDGNLIQNMGERLFANAITTGKVSILYTIDIRLEVYQGTVVCEWYYYKMVSSEIVRGERRSHTSTWQESVDF